MRKFVVIVLVLSANYVCQSARILGIIPTASYSHQVVFQPLWKELSLRGHQVTLLTTNPINDPTLTNLTEIDLSFSYKVFRDDLPEIVNTNQNLFQYIKLTLKMFLNSVDEQLEYLPVKQLINDPDVQFDLLIVEYILDVAMAFSKKFNCPYIGLLSSDPPNLIHRYMGNPTHPVLYPDLILGKDGELTLIQRVIAVLYEFFVSSISEWLFLSYQKELILKHFGLNYDILEHKKNVSLVFTNSDPIFHLVRSINPTTIPIGGKLMRLPSKPLTKDLKNILDKASGGFIYFSLGSNVNTKDVPKDTLSVILETFKELPYTILWKYDHKDLPYKPNNVFISKWLPQLEVLKHVNLKLFITHGGAQSKEEGISARVPMLGMPFFADQHFNVKKLVTLGCALSADYKTLEKNHFKATILEMIYNPIYRNQVRKLADLAEDQPMSGLDLAVWWTEYVLRHNGTRHLRSALLDIPLYQYYLLDVAAVFLLGLIFIIYVFVIALKIIQKLYRHINSLSIKNKNE